MTQEEKQLLLKDLCARLPYGVRIAYKENEHDIHHWTLCTLHAPHISKDGTIIDTGSDGWIEYVEYPGAGMSTGSRPLHLEKMLPYLRPMSSMTEEEKRVLNSFAFDMGNKWFDAASNEEKWLATIENSTKSTDYLYSKHLDIHGLIEKGLALEAPDGMYKTE